MSLLASEPKRRRSTIRDPNPEGSKRTRDESTRAVTEAIQTRNAEKMFLLIQRPTFSPCVLAAWCVETPQKDVRRIFSSVFSIAEQHWPEDFKLAFVSALSKHLAEALCSAVLQSDPTTELRIWQSCKILALEHGQHFEIVRALIEASGSGLGRFERNETYQTHGKTITVLNVNDARTELVLCVRTTGCAPGQRIVCWPIRVSHGREGVTLGDGTEIDASGVVGESRSSFAVEQAKLQKIRSLGSAFTPRDLEVLIKTAVDHNASEIVMFLCPTIRLKDAALRAAILSGNVDVIKTMHSAGCSLMQQFDNGSLLFEAAADEAVLKFLIEQGAGGDIHVDRFRKLNVAKIHFPVGLDTPEDMLFSNDKRILKPTRCWPCKHVFCGDFLHHWLKEPLSEDYPNGLKETCPKCRQKIGVVEIFSFASAAHWNESEKNIMAIVRQKEIDIEQLKSTPKYCVYMTKADDADGRVVSAQKAMRLAQKESAVAKKIADDSISADRARIRTIADAREKNIRDHQIIDKRMLNF